MRREGFDRPELDVRSQLASGTCPESSVASIGVSPLGFI
jgi:hypothetical protein